MTSHQEFTRLFKEVLAGKHSRRAVLGAGATAAAAGAAVATFGPGTTLRASAQEGTAVAGKPGGILKMGMQADPTSLDPQKQSLTAIWHVVEHIYSRLTKVNPDFTVSLELAESVDISEDGLTYTFKLRPNATFHNGRQVVASDVKYSYERLLAPETASTDTSALASMASIEAPDDATVVVTLTQPDASFLFSITDLGCIVIPRELVEENNGDISQVAVGSGPFKFVEYTPNTSVILEKNADYFEEGLPYLDGLELIIAPDDTARTTAVVTGTVDFIEYAPLRDIPILEAEESIKLTGSSNTNIRFVGFNLRKEPFNNPLVRQAIAKVIDREAILGPAVFGQGTPVVTIFPPDLAYALPTEVPATDIEGAKALLAEAGYPDGFSTTITSWSQYSFLNAAAVVIQEQLKAINIEAELNLVENATMIEQVYSDPWPFEIAVTGTSAYTDPNTLVLGNFKTGESGNFMGYSNAEVDELITQGVVETDQAARIEIYQRIQEILIEELPWINLFVANQYEAMKTYVMGYEHIATGSNTAIRQTWLDQ